MSAVVRRASLASTWVIAAVVAACSHPAVPPSGDLPNGSGNATSMLPGVGGNGAGIAVGAGGNSEAPPAPTFNTPPAMVGVCAAATYNDKYTPGQNNPPAPTDAEVQAVLNLLGLDERIRQLQGVDADLTSGQRYNDIQRSEHVAQLDGREIRGYFYRDAARGVNLDARQEEREYLNNYSTLFPVAAARGASFDLELEYLIGEAIGDETVASENTMLLAPCMNILRHPYWGRAQETYGEDVFHLGRMASAMTAGLQTNVAACAKHFAGNNVEDRRDNNNAQMADEQTLREIYGRHFEMVVQDGGVACIMAAYNSVNGEKSTQNDHLLNDILRDDFGFQGFVISDWWAMPGAQTAPSQATAQSNAAQALEAGMDLEVPWTLNYGQLDELVDSGRLTAAQINTSAARIIRQKGRFNALYRDEDIGLRPTKTSMLQGSIVNNDPHIELSRQAAVKSMVLLKNADGVLPIQAGAGIDTVAVIGPQRTYTLQSTTGQPGSNCTTAGATTCTTNFVTELQFGDRGSSRVNPDLAKTIGPAAGMTQVGTSHGISIVTGNSAAAPGVAGDILVVVVVGLTPGDEGEEYAVPAGGDRASLTLPDGQDQFIRDAIALNKPMVVVIEAGGIVNMPWLNDVPAVVMAWYPGQHGGLALAQLLFGDENFTAKMPVAWPEESDLPPFKDSELTTQMGYFLGYRYLDQNDITPIFPFGHGLSYSSFTYSNFQLGCPSAEKEGVIPVTVTVQNNTATPGEEIVFAFVSYPGTTARRSVKELKGFRKVAFAANETKQVTIPIRVQDLKYWQGGEDGQWVVESGPVQIMVGKSGAPADLTLRGEVNVL